MREFIVRSGVRVEVEDLHRFSGILLRDAAQCLAGHELAVHLMDRPESREGLDPQLLEALAGNRAVRLERDGRLYLPICWDGELLGFITAAPNHDGENSGHAVKETIGVLPTLVGLSLEKILLYKINISDRETGLHNGEYFQSYLAGCLASSPEPASGHDRPQPLRLDTKEIPSGFGLAMAEIRDFQKLREDHGDIEAVRSLRATAERLGEAPPGAVCVARLSPGRVAALFRIADAGEWSAAMREAAIAWTIQSAEERPSLEVAVGLASAPRDLEEIPGEPDTPDGRPVDQTALLMKRANMALHYAMSNRDVPVFSFADVLTQGGTVVRTLPYQRVVASLGRIAGAMRGQVFMVGDVDQKDEAAFKGEVLLYEVRDDYSLGEMVSLTQSFYRIQPGDKLSLSRMSGDPPATGELEGGLDPVLGIPGHQAFIREVMKRVDGLDRFAVLLVRVDDYERHRQNRGHIDSDRHLRDLLGLVREDAPEEFLIGRFSADSLCVMCPGWEEAGAMEAAGLWRDRCAGRLRQTCSIGVAVFPCRPFERHDVIGNAQKALEHASFLGPSSVAAFDSVSLNISGDKRFESRDLEGAVREYWSALELNPRDLNVMNSLGVCYGHLKRTDEALEMFDRVLEIDHDNLMALYNQGFLLAAEHRPEEAMERLRRAVNLAPDNFDALFFLGRTAMDLNLMEEAHDAFTRAARLDNFRPIVFRYLGQTLLHFEKPDEALEAFKSAVRYDPEDAPSLSQLGVRYLERGKDMEVALSLIRQSVVIDPVNLVFRRRLARALAAVGELEEADREYELAIKMGGRTRELLYERGRLARDLNRPDQAGSFFRQALEVDPEYAAAAEALAELNGAPTGE